MAYKVLFHRDFVNEWKSLNLGLKEIVGEVLDHLEDDGPYLGRPDIDTLKGSRFANLKEIRVRYGQSVWRFAFAFDPTQSAIILCGGEKQGKSAQLFYKQLIAKAEMRYENWLEGCMK